MMKYICNVVLEGRKECPNCDHRIPHNHSDGVDHHVNCDKLCLAKWRCIPLDTPEIKGAYLRDILERGYTDG
ncbi:MAG: hypothetical protein ACXABY_35080 [Candidatus Thorarchaeota archaeon]|jgi:hypothetical protein